MKRLGTLDRQTLVAFYVEGQSLLEMSDAFDSPVGTIKRRLHVAKRLARELEGWPSFERLAQAFVLVGDARPNEFSSGRARRENGRRRI